MGLASKIKSAGPVVAGGTPSVPMSTPQGLSSHQPSAPPVSTYGQGPPTGSTFPAQSMSSGMKYGQPLQGYGQQQPQQYGQPTGPQHSQPSVGFGGPAPQQYGGQSAQQQYGQPALQQYGGQPASQQYGGQPALQQYGQLAQQHYGGPVYSQPSPQYGGQSQHNGQVPQGYGQPKQTQASLVMSTGNDVSMLQTKLQTIISENNLQNFYDQAKFSAVMQKLSSINFDLIAAKWRIPKELAYDLAPLALYDIVFYCDDSGSMKFEENGERIDDLKMILCKVAEIATMFDDDGIIVRFMNSNVNGDGVRNSAEVEALFSQVKFTGITPLGTNLNKKVIQPFVVGQAQSNTMNKPVLTIAITDGEPSGEHRMMIRDVIKNTREFLSKTKYGPNAFALQIAQVGKDEKTQRFLGELDNDPYVGSMIDCTSYYELEAEEFMRKGVDLTPELWLLKMCVGSIDRSYDASD